MRLSVLGGLISGYWCWIFFVGSGGGGGVVLACNCPGERSIAS